MIMMSHWAGPLLADWTGLCWLSREFRGKYSSLRWGDRQTAVKISNVELVAKLSRGPPTPTQPQGKRGRASLCYNTLMVQYINNLCSAELHQIFEKILWKTNFNVTLICRISCKTIGRILAPHMHSAAAQSSPLHVEVWSKELLCQRSYAIKNQLKATKAPFLLVLYA